MSFNDFEQSIAASAPVELYTIVTPAATYRLTSFQSDIVFGGNVFIATPASRSGIHVVDMHNDSYDASLELPATHAVAMLYANGVPPRSVEVTIQRYQPSSGIAIQLWHGFVVQVTYRGRMATFRIPALTADALKMDCPSVLAQRMCNHVLYDGRCQILRADFDLAETITSISSDGKTIEVGSMPGVVGGVSWALHGEILHIPSGERRTIVGVPTATSVAIDLEFPSGSLAVGHSVTIFAGCDHTIDQCKTKFNNVLNFGGMPSLPKTNVWYVGLVATKE